MRFESIAGRLVLAGVGICWFGVDLLLFRIATLGSFTDLHYLQTVNPVAVIAFVTLAVVAAYVAIRLLFSPDRPIVRVATALGLLTAFGGAGLISLGHDSAVLITALAGGSGIVSVAMLMRDAP